MVASQATTQRVSLSPPLHSSDVFSSVPPKRTLLSCDPSLQAATDTGTATAQVDTPTDHVSRVVTEGSISVSSHKGYRTARSTIFVNEGAWYFEAVVAHLGDSGHMRIGWSTNKCELNAPVGFDEHGYGYCDVSGQKVHHRKRQSYGEAFAAGDVVGCYIYIQPAEDPASTVVKKLEEDTTVGDDGAKVEECSNVGVADESVDNMVVSSLNVEGAPPILESGEGNGNRGAAGSKQVDNTAFTVGTRKDVDNRVTEKLRVNSLGTCQAADGGGVNVMDEAAETLKYTDNGSPESVKIQYGCVAFVKNGIFQGVAYGLHGRGDFSPTVSLFTLGKVEPVPKVTLNFGPNFLHPLPDIGCLPFPKPLSESESARTGKK